MLICVCFRERERYLDLCKLFLTFQLLLLGVQAPSGPVLLLYPQITSWRVNSKYYYKFRVFFPSSDTSILTVTVQLKVTNTPSIIWLHLCEYHSSQSKRLINAGVAPVCSTDLLRRSANSSSAAHDQVNKPKQVRTVCCTRGRSRGRGAGTDTGI